MILELKFILILAAVLLVLGLILSYLSTLADKKEDSAEKRIEMLLPGINCGQCGFPGCNAYAKALADKKADVAKQLGVLVGDTNASYGDYEEQLFSPRMVAYIHENSCTGCGKCKRKCPVDAIAGVLKDAHMVDPDLCIGCDDCINTCPEKCIEKIRLDHDLSHFNWNIHSVQIKSGS